MAQRESGDYFDSARMIAVAVILIAAAAAIVGSVLNWAVIDECPVLVPNAEFGQAEIDALPPCPLRGIDIADGKIVIGAGILALAAGVLLALRATSGWAWLALLCSIVIGAIAISDYRAIGEVTSSFSERAKLPAHADPGVGLTLVAGAAFIGLLSAVAGIAATPNEPT